jgi:poly-gamma-glutamate synthesis protein (capsule biosynthesis protein)
MTQPVSLLFTGDFCPHNRVEGLSARGDHAAIFNDFIDVFQGNDLNIMDLECPLTTTTVRVPKTGPHQFAAPHTVEILRYAGVGLVGMANNHIMDCGTPGAKQTLELCRNAGIATIGIGESDAERRKPYSVTIRGKRIAILNFAENEFLQAPDGVMAANGLHPINNYRDIMQARAGHDFVILFLHGGHEFYELPSPRMKELYRFFIDLGADAVVSNHTHCFSGYEMYREKPIFYSLGNFIYDWPGKHFKDWNEGFVVRLLLDEKIQFEIVPMKQGNTLPGVFHLNDEEKLKFSQRLERLSQIISDDARLQDAFMAYCRSKKKMYESFLEPNFGTKVASLRARGFFPRLMKGRKRLLLLNLMRCESHREVLFDLLSPTKQE